MKIALLARVINQNSGARAPIKLAESFAKKGHQVDFYAYDQLLDQNLLRSLKAQNINVKIFHLPKIRVVGNLLLAIRLFFALRSKKYDFISAHVYSALLIPAKLAGHFIIRTYYGTQFSTLTISRKAGLKTNPTMGERVAAFLWDRAVYWDKKIEPYFVDLDVTISKFLQKEMKEIFHRETGLVYLGAETDQFNSSVKLGSKKSNGVINILSVSRLVPYKGFDLLINIFKEVAKSHPQMKLTIIGSVADPIYLKKLRQLQDKRIKIILNPTDKELLSYYQNCDIYASADLWVPWSLTPLEASFFAKPLLGLDRGAMSEIIKSGENGFVAKDHSQYVQYLTSLVTDKNLREKMGRNAKERVAKNFNWDKCAAAYLTLYQQSKTKHL